MRPSCRAPRRPGPRPTWAPVLAEAGIRPPEVLEPSLLTTYRRTTLVHSSRPVRLTIDADLTCSGEPGTVTALTDRVLLEVNNDTERDPVLRAIQRLGVRPIAVSKYCAGVALLHPEVPRHPWAAVLREHFAGAA